MTGSLIDLGDGRWRFWWTVNDRRRSVRFEASSRAAAEAVAEQAMGVLRTVGDAVAAWLAHGGDRRPVSQRSAELRSRRIVAGLGDRPLRSLDALTVERWLRAQRLAPATVRQYRSDLSGALRLAERAGWLDRSPMGLVELRRVKAPERPMPALADLEVAVARWSTSDVPADRDLAAVVRLGVAAGLRRGEMCALRWRDVDVPSCSVRVAGSAVRVDGVTTVGATKTGRARRVAVPAEVAQALDDLRRWKAVRGCAVGPGDFVLGDGRAPVSPDALSQRWRRLGLGRLHDLRHVAASIWLEGAPLLVASRALGHAQPSTTSNVYGHVLAAGLDRRPAEATSAAIRLGTKGSADETPR